MYHTWRSLLYQIFIKPNLIKDESEFKESYPKIKVIFQLNNSYMKNNVLDVEYFKKNGWELEDLINYILLDLSGGQNKQINEMIASKGSFLLCICN